MPTRAVLTAKTTHTAQTPQIENDRKPSPATMKPKCWPSFVLLIGISIGPGISVHADDQTTVPPDHARRMQEGLALFKEKVRPALVQNCLNCHGGKTIKAGLDLSDRAELVKTGVLDGGGAESRLMALIRHTEEPHMPQKAAKLPEPTIAAIARWVDCGAPYDQPLVPRPDARAARMNAATERERRFWSFRGLRPTTPPPPLREEAWVRTPVDSFILAALENHGLRPNPPADRRTLIRRLCFDLTGLPPSPDEIDAFVADPAPDAYECLVDRLLASPHHGERDTRHWIDVARFAESDGYEHDTDRVFAYHYRDFLVKAFNADMPYDRFVHWQLAGDELAPDDPLAMAATGFLGAGAFPTQLTEAEFESARYNELDDMVATTGSAFLGLSIGCARCHDHKYDPIPSDDYYALAAVFTKTIRSEVDIVPVGVTAPTKVQVTAEGFRPVKHYADERGFPHFYPKTFRLRRGDVAQKQGEAAPGVLGILTSGDRNIASWKVEPVRSRAGASFQRAAFAGWLTDSEYGAGALLARVMVNRLWQCHFGQGLVATPNDFGSQGSRPSHPALLDWLAHTFIENGWRQKSIHRLIVTSAVYMQDSRYDESRAAVDRENVFYWRHTPRRLEAEPIRDAMLVAAGRLDTRMYGPGTLDKAMSRRSVYFRIKRSQLVPMMMLFDWPEHLVSIGRRGTTTTAPQALSFLNGDLARRCALGFADRLAIETDRSSIAIHGYRIAFGRDPTEAETQLATSFIATQRSAYLSEGRPEPSQAALVDFCQTLMQMSEFIYIP
jgi:mono/diheme cytochrome c family protein